VEVRLLGAVEAWAQKTKVDLGPCKQRLVFAILALNVNHLVTVERLVDLTWPSTPPRTAQHAIHVRVSRLRAVMAQARTGGNEVDIVTCGSAYMLKGNPLSIDVFRFRALIARARAEQDDSVKVSLLRHALSLWHGPPLADAGSPDATTLLCQGLEEARRTAQEECIECELRLGKHATVVDELTDLVAAQPYRQRLIGLLMLALYRCGRATDALGTYRAARERLAEEMALEPEAALSELQRAVLCADPALDLPVVEAPVVRQLPQEIWACAQADDVTVEVRELSKSFGDRIAVDSISFAGRAGDVIGLLGPNGAGKTTTIRMLATLLAPSGGDFSVAGVPSSRPAEIRARIGVLLQTGRFPLHQTGCEHMAFYARLFGKRRDQAGRIAARLLDLVGLADQADARIATYTPAMRQRLGLARALINDPAVVLLDEPTLGLDSEGQQEILRLIRTVSEGQGMTFILSTHAVGDVGSMCTVTLTLAHGKAVR
jgi:ABC-type Na+ transport system ATPase subunit NatA/DNA-binding SARP family transcriptional activator